MASNDRTKRTPPSPKAHPAVVTELVVLSVMESDLKVLLIQRDEPPFRGTWALPSEGLRIRHDGDQGEDIDEAARRTLRHATNGATEGCHLEQLHTFGRAGRDPRMRVISIAWLALLDPHLAAQIVPSPNTPLRQWFSVSEEVPWMRLAFDHAEILAMGADRIAKTIEGSNLAYTLAPQIFTVAELQSVYETTQHRNWDARNFRRRFQRMVDEGIIIESPGKRHRGKARPASVWRFAQTPGISSLNKSSG
ncbi:MAG: NUDIX hydrolase [Myxococcota bacterium]